MLSKLRFLDVSGYTVHFSRVAVGNFHPAHQRSKSPVSPWHVLHFWFWHFIQHGPFDLWEARLLCSADLPFQVAWLAKKGVCVFSWIYSGKMDTPFLAKCIIVDVLPLFMCCKCDSYLPPEIWGLVPAHSSLIYNLGTLPPGRLCCLSNKGSERNNAAALWLFLTTAAFNPVLMVA